MKILKRISVFIFVFAVIVNSAVFAMSEAENKKLATFKKELSAIDKANLQAALTAEGVYVALFSIDDSEEVRDKAFELYYDFYIESAEASSAGLDHDAINANYDKSSFAASQHGYTIYSPEGAHVLGPNYIYLYNNFRTLVSDMWAEYLYYEMYAYAVAPDLYYEGTFENLRTLIISGEYIKNLYAKSKVAELISYENYLYTYIGASDFVQLYDDHKTQIARKDVVDSYEKFLAENKESEYYEIVLAAYNNLKKNNMKADFMNHTRFVRELYSEKFD